MAERALTAKQAEFVRQYLIDLNGTQAAIRAGYSEKSAERIAHQMLKETRGVADAVQEAMDQRAEATGLSAAKILADITRIGDKAESEGDWSAALKSRELLGKHRKLFTDKVEITGAATILVRDFTGRKPEPPEEESA